MPNLCKVCNSIKKNNHGVYCSRKCYFSDRPVICIYCNKNFRGSIKKKYCSSDCKKKYRLKNPIEWKGGKPRQFLEYKICGGCKKRKHYTEYRKTNKIKVSKGKYAGKTRYVGWSDIKKGWRFTRCKECERERIFKDYRLRPWIQLYSGIKRRARSKGVPFTITQEDLRDLYINAPKKCPVLDIELQISDTGNRNKRDNSPSIDRIIPEKGYIKGNLIIISDLANKIKTDATPDQIRKVADFYDNLLK